MFINLLGLLFEELVQVFTDAGEVDEPAAMNISFMAEKHGFHFSLRHQVVEGPTLDTEQPLHIPPPPKFRERGGVVGACYADWFCCHCFHIFLFLLFVAV